MIGGQTDSQDHGCKPQKTQEAEADIERPSAFLLPSMRESRCGIFQTQIAALQTSKPSQGANRLRW
jgi:hypothetical protein